MPTDTLSNDDLTRLYTWVDEIKLSRPKRNIARDFSDGVLVAEVRGVVCFFLTRNGRNHLPSVAVCSRIPCLSVYLSP